MLGKKVWAHWVWCKYFGDDGTPVFMPPADEPVPSTNHPYSPTTVQKLEPVPPVAHDTFEDTFK